MANVVLAFFAVVAPLSAHADLGAALRRSKSPVNSLPMAPPSSHLVVPLKRVHARAIGNVDASFYVGSVFVGQPPQELKVIFDTSSGHVLLPHRACSQPACLEHHRYSPWASATSMDIDANGTLVQAGHRLAVGKVSRAAVEVTFTQADLGEGTTKSVLVRDHVCLSSGTGQSGASCADVAILAAVRMEDVPFRGMPNDGIVGLGLEGLTASHLSSFVSGMLGASTSMLPQFGVSFRADGGEIHFGGHDTTKFVGPLHWFPVDHPNDGYWQVAISAVRVGGVVVDTCQSGCHGIVDTSASRLGVQASNLFRLKAALSSRLVALHGCRGPELEFDLGGFAVKLQAEDYTDEHCTPLLGALNLTEPEFVGVYAFGEVVLRRYYAAFDWQHKRLGFAPVPAVSRAVIV
jgi:hypothetical protein